MLFFFVAAGVFATGVLIGRRKASPEAEVTINLDTREFDQALAQMRAAIDSAVAAAFAVPENVCFEANKPGSGKSALRTMAGPERMEGARLPRMSAVREGVLSLVSAYAYQQDGKEAVRVSLGKLISFIQATTEGRSDFLGHFTTVEELSQGLLEHLSDIQGLWLVDRRGRQFCVGVEGSRALPTIVFHFSEDVTEAVDGVLRRDKALELFLARMAGCQVGDGVFTVAGLMECAASPDTLNEVFAGMRRFCGVPLCEPNRTREFARELVTLVGHEFRDTKGRRFRIDVDRWIEGNAAAFKFEFLKEA